MHLQLVGKALIKISKLEREGGAGGGGKKNKEKRERPCFKFQLVEAEASRTHSKQAWWHWGAGLRRCCYLAGTAPLGSEKNSGRPSPCRASELTAACRCPAGGGRCWSGRSEDILVEAGSRDGQVITMSHQSLHQPRALTCRGHRASGPRSQRLQGPPVVRGENPLVMPSSPTKARTQYQDPQVTPGLGGSSSASAVCCGQKNSPQKT